MLGWIVRILFVLAAPIAALLVSRDALNFGLVQTLVAIVPDRGLRRPGRGMDDPPAADTVLKSTPNLMQINCCSGIWADAVLVMSEVQHAYGFTSSLDCRLRRLSRFRGSAGLGRSHHEQLAARQGR
jgi:hypothetical protein